MCGGNQGGKEKNFSALSTEGKKWKQTLLKWAYCFLISACGKMLCCISAVYASTILKQWCAKFLPHRPPSCAAPEQTYINNGKAEKRIQSCLFIWCLIKKKKGGRYRGRWRVCTSSIHCNSCCTKSWDLLFHIAWDKGKACKSIFPGVMR